MTVAKAKSTADLTLISKEDIERSRTTFTFPDSGITVRMERLGMATAQTIRKALEKEFPPPEPPTQDVDYGDGTPRQEVNTADPDYEKACKAYEEKIGPEIANRLLTLAKRRMELDIDVAAVQRLRADMDAIGAPIEEEDDRTVFIDYFCFTTEMDMIGILSYLTRISQPTKEAVQEHIDSFRGDV